SQRWFVQRHAALRWLLSQYLDFEPANIRFEPGPHGKPRLCKSHSSRLNFSLSHRAGMAAIALANDASAGVDIERVCELTELDHLIADNCSPEEQQTLANAPQAEKNRMFLRQWTRREALLKAVGLGLNYPMHRLTIPTTCDETISGAFLGESSGVWSITTIDA